MEARVICKDYQKSEEVEKMAAEGRMETEELKNMLEELKQKTKDDKEQCKDMLNRACQVGEADEESLYKTLFGRLIRDCVDTILKNEIKNLTIEMCEFRRNIAQRILQDESLDENTRMNLSRMSEGFETAWKKWRLDTNDAREESSYKAFVAAVASE